MRMRIFKKTAAICIMSGVLASGLFSGLSAVASDSEEDVITPDSETKQEETTALEEAETAETVAQLTDAIEDNNTSTDTSPKNSVNAGDAISTRTSASSSTSYTTKRLTLSRYRVTLARNRRYKIAIKRVPSNTKDKITYTTTNKKVATVSSTGIVNTKKKGRAYITITSGKVKARLLVIVT